MVACILELNIFNFTNSEITVYSLQLPVYREKWNYLSYCSISLIRYIRPNFNEMINNVSVLRETRTTNHTGFR